MKQDNLKKQAAEAALPLIEEDTIIGIGTGSTVNYFIDALAKYAGRIEGAVASSKASLARLKAHHIPVIDPQTAPPIALYVDGADEATTHLQLIKGGGGALTGEKIIAAMAEQFVCIIDETKRVDVLGGFPLPIEVIPMARSLVARQCVALGGNPVYRQGFVSDHGNIILDVYGLTITDPRTLEQTINQIPGVVCNGLFALRGADKLIIGTSQGVEVI